MSRIDIAILQAAFVGAVNRARNEFRPRRRAKRGGAGEGVGRSWIRGTIACIIGWMNGWGGDGGLGHAVGRATRLAAMPFVYAVLLSCAYVGMAEVNPQSVISVQGQLAVACPFRLRFLIPALLYHTLPTSLIDSTLFRLGVAIVSSALCFVAFPHFARRFGIAGKDASTASLGFLVVLLMHYGVARIYNVYYVYDFPAILFYLLSFVLLTSSNRRLFYTGLLSTILFSLSRETILVALVHAGAYLLASTHPARRGDRASKLLQLVVTISVLVLLHAALSHWLGGSVAEMVSFRHEETLRLVANAKLLMRDRNAVLQLTFFGAGMVLWLPFLVPHLTRLEKSMMAGSLLVMLPLVIAGNFIELRIYGELTPLMAVLLTHAHPRSARCSSQSS